MMPECCPKTFTAANLYYAKHSAVCQRIPPAISIACILGFVNTAITVSAILLDSATLRYDASILDAPAFAAAGAFSLAAGGCFVRGAFCAERRPAGQSVCDAGAGTGAGAEPGDLGRVPDARRGAADVLGAAVS